MRPVLAIDFIVLCFLFESENSVFNLDGEKNFGSLKLEVIPNIPVRRVDIIFFLFLLLII